MTVAAPARPRAAEPAGVPPISGRNIVSFSHDWNGDPLSKTHFMRLLAKRNRVLWVNSIGYRAPTASKADLGRAVRKVMAAMSSVREVEPNLFVLNPLAVPAYGVAAVRRLNTALLRLQVRRAARISAGASRRGWRERPLGCGGRPGRRGPASRAGRGAVARPPR